MAAAMVVIGVVDTVAITAAATAITDRHRKP
jgi:hypothetical protein